MLTEVVDLVLSLIKVRSDCTTAYNNLFLQKGNINSTSQLWISQLAKRLGIKFAIKHDVDYNELCQIKEERCTYDLSDIRIARRNSGKKRNIREMTKDIVEREYTVDDLYVEKLNRTVRDGDVISLDIRLIFCIFAYSDAVLINRIENLDGNIFCSNVLGRFIPSDIEYKLDWVECSTISVAFNECFDRGGKKVRSLADKRDKGATNFGLMNSVTKSAFMGKVLGETGEMLSPQFDEYFLNCKSVPSTILSGREKAETKEIIYKEMRDNTDMQRIFEDWTVEFLAEFMSLSKMEINDRLKTLMRQLKMESADEHPYHTVLCLCDVYESAKSFDLYQVVYKMTLEEDFKGVIWSSDCQATLKELVVESRKYYNQFNSKDLMNQVDMIKTVSDLDELISLVARLKGLVGEIVAIETIQENDNAHYVDEHEKPTVRGNLEKFIHRIKTDELDLLLGMNIEKTRNNKKVMDKFIEKFPNINFMINKTPDFCRIENIGGEDCMVIYEMSWRTSSADREAKKIVDRNKWASLISATKRYIRLEVEVLTLDDDSVADYIKEHRNKRSGSVLARLFLDLYREVMKTKTRKYRFVDLENEQDQIRLKRQNAVKNPNLNVDEKSIERNFFETMNAADNTNPTKHLFPPGFERQMWIHINLNSGLMSHYSDNEVMSCLTEVHENRPSYLNYLSDEIAHPEEVYSKFKEKMSEIRYKSVDKPFPVMKMVNTISMSRKEMNSKRPECDCFENESQIEMKEIISHLVRLHHPGGRKKNEPIVKIKDKISKLIIRLAFLGKNVELASKSGLLIKCGKNSEEIGGELVGGFKEMTSIALADMDVKPDDIEEIIMTDNSISEEVKNGEDFVSDMKDAAGRIKKKVSEILSHLENFRRKYPEQYENLEPTKMKETFFVFIERALKLIEEGVVPCFHNRVVISKWKCDNIRNKFGMLLGKGEKGNNILRNRTSRARKDDTIEFITDQDVSSSKLVKFFQLSSEATSSFTNKMKERLKGYLDAKAAEKDSKISRSNIDWLINCLMGNKYFCLSLIRSMIAETLSAATQKKRGLTIRALTDDFNIYSDTVSYDSDQIIFLIENRWTGELSDAMKFDIKKLNAMELETNFIISLIGSSLEQRNLFGHGDESAMAVKSHDCDEWIQFLRGKFKEIQENYRIGNAPKMVSVIEEIRLKRASRYRKITTEKRVQEIISYFSFFVGPFISENNKNANAVLQMCRYFYSYNFSIRMNIKELVKKLCVPVRGFASQQMVSVATACYFYNIRANRLKDNVRPKEYSEIHVMKGMIDFFSNMEDISDSLQFCNAIYYVHAADRMEMDPRAPIDAYNMFCEKVGSWKTDVNETIDRMCLKCKRMIKQRESLDTEDVKKTCEEIINNWEKRSKSGDTDSRHNALTSSLHRTIECCEDDWVRLECLYGYQLFRRTNKDHCMRVLKRKLFLINETNVNYTFYCWELLNEAGFSVSQSIGEGEVDKLIEKVGILQINEMASTTNTKVSFPDGYNPVMASELISKLLADKVTRSVASEYKEIEKRLKDEGKKFDSDAVSAEILSAESGDSQLNTTLMEIISKSLKRSFADFDKNTQRCELYTFKQICNEPRVMSVFMKDFYRALKESKKGNSRVSRLMKNMRDVFREYANKLREKNKCKSAFEFFKVLKDELLSEGSEVNKFRDKMVDIVASCDAEMEVSGGMKIQTKGDENGPSGESQEKFSELFEKLTRLNKMRCENSNMNLRKEYGELYDELISLRTQYDSDLLKCFLKVVVKSMGLGIRWLVDRKHHSKLIRFAMDAEAYVGPKVGNLTPMEWFVMNMCDKDYDLSVMFEMEPKSMDQLFQLKRIGVTLDQKITYGDFIRTLDIATHSTIEYFEDHKKESLRHQRIIAVRSDKAINAILDICKNKGISSLMELCKLIAEDESIHMRAGIAGKQQFGPIRDLGILGIDIRPLQFYVERCCSELLSLMPNDMMVNINRKKDFLDSVVNYYKDMKASGKYNCYSVAGDNSSWGPKHQNTAFLTCLSPLMRKNKTLYLMFTNFCLKAMHKKIYINDMIAKRCENTLMNNGLRWNKRSDERFEVIDRFQNVVTKETLVKTYEVPKEMADIIIDQLAMGRCYIETDSHMIQGICHKQSSLLHCCVQAYFTKLINNCYSNEVKINMICSSDDYGVTYKFTGKGTDFDGKMEVMERMRNILMLGCNISNSPKTIISRCHLGEIYSSFVTPLTALQPTIKQSCAMISAPLMPSPLDECYLTFELARMLFCAGGTVLTTNVGLLCRYLRNCSVKGSSFSRSYNMMGKGNSFIPFINNPRLLSMSDILGGLETAYSDRLRELLTKDENDLSRGEMLELSCFAESSKIELYDDMSTKLKQVSKTETVYGNPVKFKPTESMIKLRKELRNEFTRSDNCFYLDEFIRDIISENQPAYDLESTMNKLSQAFMSESIIYNLVGSSSRDTKTFARMCYGGYYWESYGFVTGPTMNFSRKSYLSVSNIRSWETVNKEATLLECHKSMSMIKRRVSSSSKTLTDIKKHIENMTGDFRMKDEVRMTKRTFRRDEKTKYIRNTVDDVVCCLLDRQTTIEQGSEVKLDSVDLDIRILEQMDEGLSASVQNCVEYDENGKKIISKENAIKIKKLVSSMRSARNSSMEVVMQYPSKFVFDNIQVLARNKIVLNRSYILEASTIPVLSVMPDGLREIHNYFTVLNNLDPLTYDLQKSWRNVLNKSDIITKMNNEILRLSSDVDQQLSVKRLSKLGSILNSSGESLTNYSEGMRTAVINKNKIIDKFSVITGTRSERKERYLIVTIEDGMIESSTNEMDPTKAIHLIKKYCARNSSERRYRRPMDVKEFYRLHTRSIENLGKDDIFLMFSMQGLYPASLGTNVIRVRYETLNTQDVGFESMRSVTSDALAISQNRTLGLQIGHIMFVPEKIDRLEWLKLAMQNRSYIEVLASMKKSYDGEFRSEMSISDVDEMSIDDLKNIIKLAVRKDESEIRKEFKVPRSSRHVVTVPTMDDALLLGRSMELITLDRSEREIKATYNIKKGMFYSSLSARMKKISECIKSGKVKKNAIGIITAFAEDTFGKAINGKEAIDEIDDMLDSATDVDFEKLLSQMTTAQTRVYTGTNRMYYQSTNEIKLEIETDTFHIALLPSSKDEPRITNTKRAMRETIEQYPELHLSMQTDKRKDKKWTHLRGPSEYIDWAEVFVLGIGSSYEQCRLLNKVTAFFSGLTSDLPTINNRKGLSKKKDEFGWSDSEDGEEEEEGNSAIDEEIEIQKDNFNKIMAYLKAEEVFDPTELDYRMKEILSDFGTTSIYLDIIMDLTDRYRYDEELKILEDDSDKFYAWREKYFEKQVIEEFDEEEEDDDQYYNDVQNRYNLLMKR